MVDMGQGGHTTGWRGVGASLLPSLSPFGYFHHLVKYDLLDDFLELPIFSNLVS
jgi:hypothetical protein